MSQLPASPVAATETGENQDGAPSAEKTVKPYEKPALVEYFNVFTDAFAD